MKHLFLLFTLFYFSLSGRSQNVPFTSFRTATQFFMKRLQYPQDAIDSSQMGFVLMAVKLKAGEIISATVIHRDAPSLEKEVFRVLNQTTSLWKFIDREATLIIPFEFYTNLVDDTVHRLPPILGNQAPQLNLISTKGNAIIVMAPISLVTIDSYCYPPLNKSTVQKVIQ